MRGILKLIGVSLGLFFFIIILTATVSFIRHTWFGSGTSSSNHVRVMDLSGVILSSSTFIESLKSHLENSHTKAIVVRVNSPGGVVAPSQEIYEAVKKADTKVPVIISMGSLAASGGYYVALGGRKIFANPGTLTGSIGVIMEFVNTKKLYEWAKLDRYSIVSGKFKDAGSPLKTMNEEEKALFQKMVKDIYTQFRGTVKERRKLEDEALDKVTDGRVLTGAQALEAKLVDNLGGLEDAIAEAKTIAKLPEDATVIYPHKGQGMLRRWLVGDDEEEDASSLTRFWNALTRLVDQAPTASPGGASWRVLWMAPLH